jgi:hypothetical protein
MAMKVRVLLSSVVLLATLWLASCGHYTCGATFGSSTCTSSGGGLGQGGGTGAAASYAFVDTGGTIEELSLNTTAGTLLDTTGYTGPTTPNEPGFGMVVAQGQYLYTSFPGVGQIYGYTISASGAVTQIGTPVDASYMIGSTLGGLQSFITNPAGTLLFVLNPDGPAVYVYTIGTGGALTAAGSTLLPFLPENMGTDGLGNYLYVTSASTDTSVTPAIAAYTINNTNGSLTSVSGSPFSGNLNGVLNAYGMLQVEGDPSGKYLIGTTSAVIGDNHLYVYNIQQTGATAGAITPVSGSPFTTTYSPYRIAVQPSAGGDLVYSFSLNGLGTGDNAVEGYTLNTSTGALTAIAGSPFITSSNTGDWGQFDQSGTYLYVLDTTTTVMAVYNVGTTGGLTQPVATVGFFPGPWAIADVP